MTGRAGPLRPRRADVAGIYDRGAAAYQALAEAARVLRPGGQAGTVTWAWERGPRASTVWDQILTEASVPPAPLRRADAGLDRPGAVEALLRSAGLRPARIWTEQLHHQWDRSSFWELASGSAASALRPALACWPARKTPSASLAPGTSWGKAKSSAP